MEDCLSTTLHPLFSENFPEAGLTMPKQPRRNKRYLTLRLFEEDRELLQNLGRGRPEIADRYEAFLEVNEIVQGMEFPDIRKKKRRPIRIAIPQELEATITGIAEATGQPFLTILLEAAREYRRRHPLTRKK
jgi:hypothetical protein